jgi:hypothetical protein
MTKILKMRASLNWPEKNLPECFYKKMPELKRMAQQNARNHKLKLINFS